MEGLHVHTVSGNAVDVSMTGVRSVADVRQLVAAALGVDGQELVKVKLFNGIQEVDDATAPQDLDIDAGLLAVLDRVIPDWYPRGKYVYHDQEVLRITGTQSQNDFVAEFVNGSTQEVEAALFDQAVREWSWQTVTRQGRVWAHPPEKPAESGGWYDIFTAENVRKGALRGAGLVSGFVLGIAGPSGGDMPNIDPNGNFGASFNVGFFVGFAAWGTFQLAQLASHFIKK